MKTLPYSENRKKERKNHFWCLLFLLLVDTFRLVLGKILHIPLRSELVFSHV